MMLYALSVSNLSMEVRVGTIAVTMVTALQCPDGRGSLAGEVKIAAFQ